MNAANSGHRARRARIYFRLMDITLALALIGFAEFLLSKVWGITPIPRSSSFYRPISSFFIFMNFFVPFFLILARFMRDEYAELLWRRTAVVMTYALSLAPIQLLVFFWAAYFQTGKMTKDGPFAFVRSPVDPVLVIAPIWAISMLVFVAIFQFLRWRDSR